MCRGGDKAIDTNFKEESIALRIDGHGDDAGAHGDDASDSTPDQVTNIVLFLDKLCHVLWWQTLSVCRQPLLRLQGLL